MTSILGRVAASAIVAASLCGADGALAQSSKSTPAPAAPAAPAGAPAPGPVKLDLVGLQPQWIKQCSKDPAGHEACMIQREFGQVIDQPPTLVAAIVQMGEERHYARFVLPLGFLLRPGFRLYPEKGEPVAGGFLFCLPQGCFAEAELGAAGINALKKSSSASVVVRKQDGNEVTFTIPMKDFAAAYDGPAIDPKVLEQQSQEQQDKLEKEAIKRREALEKQQSTPPK
jgi:invasion protein IalB